MRSLFARAMNADAANIPAEKLIEFKEAVSTILTPYASSILLDPEVGLPAAKLRAKTAGLLLAYEQTGYDKNVPGRLPRLPHSGGQLRPGCENAPARFEFHLPFYRSNR